MRSRKLASSFDAASGRTDFLCQHIVLFQQLLRIVKQFNGFLPETDIWFYVALYGGVWGTATATLSAPAGCLA